MALACRETERYDLVATIVNALAHHGSAVDPDQAMTHLITSATGRHLVIATCPAI